LIVRWPQRSNHNAQEVVTELGLISVYASACAALNVVLTLFVVIFTSASAEVGTLENLKHLQILAHAAKKV